KVFARPDLCVCLADDLISAERNHQTPANSGSRAFCFAAAGTSIAGEYRLALFEERAAALLVIAAREAALDHFGAAREVALRLILRQLADNELRRRDGERRVGGNRLGVVAREGLDLGIRHSAI